MTVRFACVVLVSLAGGGLALDRASTAWAQGTPMSVNDCTMLPDPAALKRCVDGFGAQSLRPALPLPAPSGATEPVQAEPAAKTTAAAPAPSARAADWLHEGNRTTKPLRASPNAIKLDE